jgi:DNA-binding NtrC family response regulator
MSAAARSEDCEVGDLANVRCANAPLDRGQTNAQTGMPLQLMRALVVDGDPTRRRLVMPALQERHFEVVESSDFTEAFRYICQNSVDLVVAELHQAQRPDPINLPWLIRIGAFGEVAPPLILYLDPALTTSIDLTGPMAEAFIIPAPIAICDLDDALDAALALGDPADR